MHRDHRNVGMRKPGGGSRFASLATRASTAAALSFALIGGLGGTTTAHAADTLPSKAPPAKAAPAKIYSTILFSGFDARDRSYYGFGGVIHALNGNLATDGFMVRLFGYYNPYDYDSTAVVGGKVDGRLDAYDAVIGYQKYFSNFVGRVYVGYDYEHHGLSPDNPFDSNRGAQSGVKFRGEIDSFYDSPYYFSVLSSYGSAKHRYYVRGRAGYNFSGIILGPEAVGTGNPETDEGRVGAFATFRTPLLAPVEISISGGYSNVHANRGGPGGYGTVEVSLAF